MTIQSIKKTIWCVIDDAIMNPIRDYRASYRKRLLEGNWYFDGIRYSQMNGTLEVRPRKWNLIMGDSGDYKLYGDAPLGVARLITIEGKYTLSQDGNLVFHEVNDKVKHAHISKLNRKELVYYIDGSDSGRHYYSFMRL